MAIKKIGVTCDDYKTEKFRERLLKEGFILEHDNPLGNTGVHLFRIEIEETDLATMRKLAYTLSELELFFKHSN